MARGKRPSLFAPHVEQYLLKDEGEFIVDEIVKHWVCMIVPVLTTLGGIGLIVLSGLVGGYFWPVLLIPGLVVAFIGLWKYHFWSMYRFVVTNTRVYRVSGIVTRDVATMPLTRILDISVRTPFFGMILNYGTLTFESAAAGQGLREITYVPSPAERDLTIQRVIQRAGLRAMAHRHGHEDEEDDGT
ncbi:MAG: PH domain-containing protein [Propionibacteriaceae bacterium]|nr:PH domain-containing protein [Propionibacteriaceae bacterium]